MSRLIDASLSTFHPALTSSIPLLSWESYALSGSKPAPSLRPVVHNEVAACEYGQLYIFYSWRVPIIEMFTIIIASKKYINQSI